jgi:hypothetical protein
MLTRVLAMLFAMCTDQGDQLQLYMYMPCSKGPDERRPESRMCELWV